MDEMDDILAMAKASYDYTVACRRHCHENPECGPAEQLDTLDFIEQQLEESGLRHVRVPGGGVLGFLDGPAGGKTMLLRADIDALPIEEDTSNLVQPKACVSKRKGVMHACGHDAHIAMLLTEAKLLKKMQPRLKGSVIFMFEEGEEGYMNIEPLCRYIRDEKLSIDGCYATHVRWNLPTGVVGYAPRIAMSGLQAFYLDLHGLGGHGSRPDLANSTVDCFAQIYTALQAVRMNSIRPDTCLTWSVGTIEAGTRDNVIPDRLECTGTIRMFDVDCGEAFWQRFQDIVAHTCAACGCTGSLTRRMYLLPTINDPACVALFRESATQAIGQEALKEVEPWMASESFSYMSSLYPSVFSYVGIQNDALGSGANHHTPQFDLDESGMPLGVAAAVAYTQAFLAAPPETSGFTPVCGSVDELLQMLHE